MGNCCATPSDLEMPRGVNKLERASIVANKEPKIINEVDFVKLERELEEES